MVSRAGTLTWRIGEKERGEIDEKHCVLPLSLHTISGCVPKCGFQEKFCFRSFVDCNNIYENFLVCLVEFMVLFKLKL